MSGPARPSVPGRRRGPPNGLAIAYFPGPTAGTVYVGGQFGTVNGVKSKGVTLLNLGDGSIVSGFKPPALNGIVEAMRLSGGSAPASTSASSLPANVYEAGRAPAPTPAMSSSCSPTRRRTR